MITNDETGITSQLLKEASFTVPKDLPGKCCYCPRSFYTGERIVFFMQKRIQAKVIMDKETGVAGPVEQHALQLMNAHLDCAEKNKNRIRSVCNVKP